MNGSPSVTRNQGSPVLLLESYSPAKFSSNPNQGLQSYLKMLSRSRFGDPCSSLINVLVLISINVDVGTFAHILKHIRPFKNIVDILCFFPVT